MPPKKSKAKSAGTPAKSKTKKQVAVVQLKQPDEQALTSGVAVGLGSVVPKNTIKSAPPTDQQSFDTAAINRLFRTKLKKIDKDELCALVGKNTGLSVRLYLQRGIDEKADPKKHLSSRFWSSFFAEFGLQSPMFEGLEQLVDDDGEEADPELLDALVEVYMEISHRRRSSFR